MTCDGEMMNEPAGPVIDDELVDRLMAQVDAEGLDLRTSIGGAGTAAEADNPDASRHPPITAVISGGHRNSVGEFL